MKFQYQIDNLELSVYEDSLTTNDVVAEILSSNEEEQYKEVVGYWLNSDLNKFILNTDINNEFDWYDLKELISMGSNYLIDSKSRKDKIIDTKLEKLINQLEEVTSALDFARDSISEILEDINDLVDE